MPFEYQRKFFCRATTSPQYNNHQGSSGQYVRSSARQAYGIEV